MASYNVKINGEDAPSVTAESDNAAVDAVRVALTAPGAFDIEVTEGVRPVSKFSCFVEVSQ